MPGADNSFPEGPARHALADLNLRPRLVTLPARPFFTAILLVWARSLTPVEQYPGARLTLRQGARVIPKLPE